MIELEKYIEQAFNDGIITWEQKNIIIAATIFSDDVQPHRGLDMLRTMLQREEWMDFLRIKNYVTKDLESELSRISPFEGLIRLEKIFKDTKKFNIEWNRQEMGFRTISRYISEQKN